jgi:hypothetical protein
MPITIIIYPSAISLVSTRISLTVYFYSFRIVSSLSGIWINDPVAPAHRGVTPSPSLVPSLETRERVAERVWFGIVLLSVLVDEPTDEGYHARDLDKRAAMENIRMVGGEKALPNDSCQLHVRYSTDIVWQGLEFSIQKTNLVVGAHFYKCIHKFEFTCLIRGFVLNDYNLDLLFTGLLDITSSRPVRVQI